MRTVLVTGATGAVGPAVVRALQNAGWNVRVLLRGTSDVSGAEVCRGDLRDRESLERAGEGVDAVVHMAGLLHLFHAGPERDADFESLNVDATRHLLNATPGARWIFFSSISVYGSGGPFTEDSPVNPPNAYARTKLAAERLVLAAGGTVFRLAAVYGARMKGNYASLVRTMARRRFVAVGEGDNHRTLVRDLDVGDAVVLALESDAAPGKIYNVTDGSTHTVKEIIVATAEALGRRPPLLSVPVGVVRMAGRLVPRVRRLLDKYLEDVRVDGTKLQRELNFRPQAEFRTGWIDSVRSFR